MTTETQAKLITSQEDLSALVDALSTQSSISVDTESNSLHAYQEQVCLIQFTIPEGDFLVDPLALVDLSPLADIFANPDIEKIFHAAEYDLIVLRRDFDFQFAHLFDTMVAARIAGRKKVGLGSLLEEEFQVRVAKKFQRADWGRRPLSADMLDYARLDTVYLLDLRNILEKQLKEMDRWQLAQEDFARMPSIITDPLESKINTIWRIKGVRDLRPNEAAILHKLAHFREKEAIRADVPLFKILGDRTLVAIAALSPQNRTTLGDIEGMTNGQIRRFGDGLLSAVRQGLKAAPMHKPRLGNYDSAYSDRLEVLREWRKVSARKIEVESDVILPRDLMESIAREKPQSVSDVKEILSDLPWRSKHYSEELFTALRKTS